MVLGGGAGGGASSAQGKVDYGSGSCVSDFSAKVVKFISPNIVRLSRDGERKRRVANVMQLKPFFQDEEGDDQDPTTENPDETKSGESKNVNTA
ncbi:hypothetical protein ACLKA6_000672 [Drosophila palustris]